MTQEQEPESVVTDEMREAIGKEGPPQTLEVEKTGCRMFARAIGHTDLIFYDEEYARSKGYRGIVAPPGFLGTRSYKPAGAGDAGPPGIGYTVPYKSFLTGCTENEYLATVCA
ncbi:MAG: MaoC family dehydratase N-terminal domain-containing protein, partial [Dehalococcoidia bacterium]|nr:MaoC family dehydratase N-terminal domain-containing protein [Dehalococcoidia bacterium]